MLKILGRVTSINARKVLWALDEMGVAYEREDWGVPLRDPRTPEFLELNPNAQVPVIIEDGFVLWESGAILRYLSDRHRSGLWPADPHERALVDQWVTWQSTELNPSWGYPVAALLPQTAGLRRSGQARGRHRGMDADHADRRRTARQRAAALLRTGGSAWPIS